MKVKMTIVHFSKQLKLILKYDILRCENETDLFISLVIVQQF